MPSRTLARLLAGGIVCLVCVAWLDSPLRPSATRRLQLLGVAPQAWGYFTSPRSETFEVYRRGDAGWSRLDAPIAAAANLFGLRRSTVNHGAEFRNIVVQVGNRWTEKALTAEQLPDAPDHVVVEDFARQPKLCGDVLLVARPPVPWAWARTPTRAALTTKFVRLDVQC